MEIFPKRIRTFFPNRVQRCQLHLQEYHKEQTSPERILRGPKLLLIPAGHL